MHHQSLDDPKHPLLLSTTISCAIFPFKLESTIVDIGQPVMAVLDVINEVNMSPQLSFSHPDSPELESTKVVNEIQVSSPQVAMQPLEMPSISTPEVNISTP